MIADVCVSQNLIAGHVKHYTLVCCLLQKFINSSWIKSFTKAVAKATVQQGVSFKHQGKSFYLRASVMAKRYWASVLKVYNVVSS